MNKMNIIWNILFFWHIFGWIALAVECKYRRYLTICQLLGVMIFIGGALMLVCGMVYTGMIVVVYEAIVNVQELKQALWPMLEASAVGAGIILGVGGIIHVAIWANQKAQNCPIVWRNRNE